MTIQHIAFRADVSKLIGTGHFMRCLTLAEDLKRQGVHIRFISRHLPVYLQNMLADKGYEFIILVSTQNEMPIDELAHASWLGVSQEQDAIDSVQALSDLMWNWLIVDHYALDHRWESRLRQSSNNILIIDDIADRQHDCDVLLDQNFYSDMDMRYTGKVPSHCHLLLGPKYALLRKEFRLFHQQIKPRNGSVKRLLVFFGGVDADNYTGLIIDTLSEIRIPNLHIDVVIGSQHPYREKIKEKCVQYEFNCYVQTDKMAELMAAADLAIGAGGSATWERCCLALPTLMFSLAHNQIEIAKEMDVLGAGQYFDLQLIDIDKDLHKTIVDLINDKRKIEMFSDKAYSIVDGLGVDRLCEVLIQ